MKQNEKPTVLIIDDSPVNVQVLAQALMHDYQVKVATTGEKALEIAGGDAQPDLVLLDIIMPGIDGFEICRRLKRDDRTRDIPVIFITVVEDEAAGLELGAVDYITKPFDLRIVKARVRTHIELKCKSDMLAELVLLDGLTTIGNRRHFDEVLPREWRRCARRRLPLSMIMLDVDSFRTFNENYGHSKGDDCLRQVARSIEAMLLRGGDQIMRYGGEEFAIVLPETDAEGAVSVAARLRQEIEQLAIPHEFSNTAEHITASFGVATVYPAVGLDPLSLVRAANETVHAVKRDGGNAIRSTKLEEEPAPQA